MTYSVTLSGTTFTVDMTAVSFPVTLSQVGQQGATGASWQGAWALSTDYAVNDVVSSGGSAYICILAHTSASTDEPGVGVNTATYWAILAAGGADGTDGIGFTGGSYDGGTGVVTFTSDDGLGFSTGDLRGADGTGFTGGSYNAGDGTVTFTSDDGLGFSTGDLRGADGVSFTWLGPWTTAADYAADDVVENDGSSYICILGHTSSASDEPGVGVNTATYWELVAQKGADGAGVGTVTSIDITGGTGVTSSGGPITSSGAITVALDAASQDSLALADSALQSSDIGVSVQGYSAILAATTASFTTADETKLDGIETGATADQTGAEIKTAYEGEPDTNAYTDAEKSKLAGIEAGADVTDAINVAAAGALMDSEVANLAEVKAFDPADYATEADVETTTINAQTGTAYTLALTDRGQTVTMDNASANTVTIPTSASVAFAVGSVVTVLQKGAGVTTIAGATGVTVNGVSAGSGDMSAQWQGVALMKIATDEWVVSGAIGAVT